MRNRNFWFACAGRRSPIPCTSGIPYHTFKSTSASHPELRIGGFVRNLTCLSMNQFNQWSSLRDTQPLTWWGNIPVYATTILVLAHCLAFAFVSLAAPLGYDWLVSSLVFSSTGVLGSLQIWQIFTYAFISLPPSFWFLIEMAMLYYFGQEVEKYLGRRLFLTLYALLIVIPPFAFILAGLFGSGIVLAGAGSAHFSLFIAFAVITPGAMLFFNISARWFAVGFFVFNSLILISYQDWTRFAALWLDAGTTLLFLRGCGVRSLQSPDTSFRFPTMGDARSILPQKARPEKKRPLPAADPMRSIDPILEKISKHGIGSLTPVEKSRLEKARAALLEKEKAFRE
jgi:hypothetical protein